MTWSRHQPDADTLARLRQELAVEQARAEQLAAVLHSVDAAVLALDRQQHRIFANPAADRLLPSLARLPQLLQRIEAAATSGQAWNSRLPLPDERTLEVHLTPMGEGCVVVARDVTATVHLETTRRDFVASISHELRTPLTSIQGYAELLQSIALAEPVRQEYLQAVIDNASRLARLASDLVTLSSIETGTYPFRFASLSAAALVPPALAVLQPLAEELGSHLGVGKLDEGQIRADPEALHRVLLNLAENALLHAGAGVRIEVSGQVEDDHYVYRVQDNGVGIGSLDQPRIFERFYRVSRGNRSSTGLGLALVKHIVSEHGGRLELQSALGQGSTFVVKLPLL